MDIKLSDKIQSITTWEANKPKTDAGWSEDVKAENLDVKFNNQLDKMLTAHSEKIDKVQEDLDIFTKFPDVKKYELTKQFEQMFKDAKVKEGGMLEGKTLKQWIDEEFESQQLYYTWKVAKLNQSVERISKEIELRNNGYLEVKEETLKGTLPKDSNLRIPLGTTYYIDPVNGTDTYTGTRIDSTIDSTADTTHFVDNALTGADDYINGSYFYNVTRGIGSLITDFVAADDTVTLAGAIAGMTAGDTYYILHAWCDLDQFTENARSAGDVCIIRRGANQMDDGTDLAFTSDGTVVAPIVIEADFDNLWRDQTDLSATATATLTFGSKTVTFSTSVAGVLAAGDWIYANGDNNREFAYEVASVSTVTVTLYLPYKGNQAGSGKTMYNMQDNPIWNTAAGDLQWNFDTDDFWKVQGIHIRGTDANGAPVEIDSCRPHIFIDCIFEGNGGSDYNLNLTDDSCYVMLSKCRLHNSVVSIRTGNTDCWGYIYGQNCLIDGNNVASSVGTSNPGSADASYALTFKDSEFKNHASQSISQTGVNGRIYLRNVILGATELGSATSPFGCFLGSEDHDGATIGDNRYHGTMIGNFNVSLFQTETGTVRVGGAIKTIKVTPTANMSNISGWEYSKQLLFEIPIYTTTDSKTYTVYFNLPDANFTTAPTSAELWIELEAWGHATNKFRKITKSTGTVTDNGNWQSLTVTVAPDQVGIAYLRCFYCKTKEAGTNIFYVDPIPVIS